MILLFAIVFLALGIAVLVAGVALICRLLLSVGVLRRPWQFMVLCPVMMASYPLWAIRQNQLETAACIAANGPLELSCTGEIGGLFLDLLRWGALFGSLLVGPLLGRFLARRWLKAQGNVPE